VNSVSPRYVLVLWIDPSKSCFDDPFGLNGTLSMGHRIIGTSARWDLGRRCELHTLSGHTGLVRAVAVTQSGELALSASDDKTLKV
jgi:WD40 repeat protein